MRLRIVLAVIGVLALAAGATAQTTTGTISGRVLDTQGLALPGATATATSPNLQGTRESVTSENGDYILTGLPSGPYTISFSLSGFQTQTRNVVLAPTQALPLEVRLGPAQVTEEVNVVANSADTLTKTAQIATNFSQELIANLPTSRDLNSVLLMAPGVHPTGPAGAFSFGGSVSFENLFLLNGVSINENIRGQAFDTAIEDAIQETTVANGGVSAEFGRFSGGVVNIITKSGGNRFSGSFRQSLNNDKWRTLSPFETERLATTPEPRIDKVVPTYEYTIGGPILRDRLWFFTSGRLRDETQGRTLVATAVPYEFREEQRRYEVKGTYSLTPKHRFQMNYNHHDRAQINYSFNQNLTMDTRSLGTRQLPERLYAATYSGMLSSKLFVEALVSKRTLSFIGAGAKSTDLIDGTLLIDNSRAGGARWWSDTFCGVCTPEGRDSEDFFAKASYFLSTPRFGSHNLVFGYDNFNDIRTANNHQSGSDYRILSAGAILTGAGAGANDIFPIFLGDGTTTIQWNPIPLESEGSSFRTHSGFINDTWRVGNRLTANVGLRFDKNDGADQSGNVVAKDSAWSPRLGLTWDPTGAGQWTVTGSVAKYVAAISNPVADSSAAGGNPQTRQFIYRGASINGSGTTTPVPTAQAIQSVFDWFFANGGPTLPLNGAPTIPGVTPRIADGLTSPSAWEYAGGLSRQFGARASAAGRPAGAPLHRLLHAADRYDDGPRAGSDGPIVRPRARHERAGRPAVARLCGRDVHRHLPLRTNAGARRQLHAVESEWQLRRRERGERTGPVRLSLSRVQAGRVELPRWRPRRRSAAPFAALGQLHAGLRAGPDAERSPGARERRALQRVEQQRSGPEAVRHQSEQRVSDPARIDDDGVLLRSARRVPHRGAAPYRSGAELHLSGSRSGPAAALRPGAGAERLQPVPALRVRQHGLRHRQRRQRRRRQPAASRHDGADAGHDRTVRHLQPVHDDAGPRRELGLRPELRHRRQPLRVHDAAHDQDVVWREVLRGKDP